MGLLDVGRAGMTVLSLVAVLSGRPAAPEVPQDKLLQKHLGMFFMNGVPGPPSEILVHWFCYICPLFYPSLKPLQDSSGRSDLRAAGLEGFWKLFQDFGH